jgi:hypothetical protein
MASSLTARVALAAIACVALTVPGRAQSVPVEVGTWTLNLGKSKFSPGPAPKASTVTYSAAGQGLKAVIDGVGPDSSKVHWEYTANTDGKSYPVTGNPDADMVVVKRVDANTLENTYTLKGKQTVIVRRTVSADRKTLTVTQTGTNAQGQKLNHVLVFERN